MVPAIVPSPLPNLGGGVFGTSFKSATALVRRNLTMDNHNTMPSGTIPQEAFPTEKSDLALRGLSPALIAKVQARQLLKEAREASVAGPAITTIRQLETVQKTVLWSVWGRKGKTSGTCTL